MSLGVKYQPVLGRPHNVCRRCPEDVGRGRPIALHVGRYGCREVVRALHLDALRTSVGDIPWRYIEDRTGTSIRRLLGTS